MRFLTNFAKVNKNTTVRSLFCIFFFILVLIPEVSSQQGVAFDGKHDSKLGLGFGIVGSDPSFFISSDFGQNNYLSTFFVLHNWNSSDLNPSFYKDVHLHLGLRLHFSEILNYGEKNDFYIGPSIGFLNALSFGAQIGWYRSISKNFGINGLFSVSKYFMAESEKGIVTPNISISLIWN